MFALAVIVGNKPEPVPNVVRTDARGLDRHCPHGVSHFFQVTSHKGEPLSRSRNLLSKHDCRTSLADKGEPVGPEVPGVLEPFALARGAERLAGAASGPDRPVVGPIGHAQGCAPSSETREKMTLGEAVEVACPHVDDASVIHDTLRYETLGHEVPQPLRAIRIVLVVVCRHAPEGDTLIANVSIVLGKYPARQHAQVVPGLARAQQRRQRGEESGQGGDEESDVGDRHGMTVISTAGKLVMRAFT